MLDRTHVILFFALRDVIGLRILVMSYLSCKIMTIRYIDHFTAFSIASLEC